MTAISRRQAMQMVTAVCLLTTLDTYAFGASEGTMYRFDFSPGSAAASGWQKVAAENIYTPERGYGFMGESAKGTGHPFTFAVDLPEGNYTVTLRFGDPSATSETTVRAESRRLMLEKVTTRSGEYVSRTFTINLRTPHLKSGGEVSLKGDEKAKRDWDGRLTLDFSGSHPAVASIEIKPDPKAVTVYLAGDSTVTDQEDEPWAAWGQMLPRFFLPGIAIANHAQSGEALKSFRGEKRLEKILDTIHTGDYLFIQFAHNDQKAGAAHVDPFTDYTELVLLYANEARKRGAYPVLVTSMHRRRFDEQGHITNTLGDYPEAMRRLAQTEKLPLIDLNAMSKVLFEALGVENTKHAFVHYPAGTFPNQKEALKDDTHFNEYGAYELARCVVEGIRATVPTLAKSLRDDIPHFDPAHPDPLPTTVSQQ